MKNHIKHLWMAMATLLIIANAHSDAKVIINHFNWNPSHIAIEKLDKVRTLKIMFGHQSVGTNIVDGLTALSDSNSVRYGLNILFKPSNLTSPAFGHWKNGENQDPHSKIIAFDAKMRSQVGSNDTWADILDIGYFKFCYVDLNLSSINTDSLYEDYVGNMMKLISDYPECKFVHVTIPLSALIYGSDKDRNKRRHEFNVKIRSLADITEGYLFDLADIESHDGNGILQTYELDGNEYPMMWYDSSDPDNNGWSYDGGHLNNKGKEHIALAMWSLWVALTDDGSSEVKKSSQDKHLPEQVELFGNYPNPFNTQTTLIYNVPIPQKIKIDIFNSLGHYITTIVDNVQHIGFYTIKFNAENLKSGVYLYRIQNESFQQTKKMTLLR
ncbi:MAG: T9SS type A sorting domain-containing protein [Candidatus Zhuqueibacterota bacterium]